MPKVSPVEGEVAMKPPGCGWEFHSGVIGLSESLCVYDGGIGTGHAADLPDGEAAALADYMIALWRRFRGEEEATRQRHRVDRGRRGAGVMHPMERIKAVQAATESDTPFLHATNMEDPLTTIGNLVAALCLISETMEEPFGSVVQELARKIGDSVQQLDKEHAYFFHLHHPCPPLDDGDGSEN
jgi:hypothetical protein